MYTLLQLERTHGCPMVVRDDSLKIDYVIIKVSPDSFAMYEAKKLSLGSRSAPLGSPSILLSFGGYPKWLYLGRPDRSEGITPEDQKKAVELERKRLNDKLTRELKGSRSIDKHFPEPPAKKKQGQESKVIQFRPRNKEDKE